MTTKITIVSVFGHHNKGDAAIFASLLSHVEDLVPDVEISAVVRHPETEVQLYRGIRIEEQLLRSTAQSRALKLLQMLWFSSASLLWIVTGGRIGFFLPRRKRQALLAIRQADLVLSCGGGFLHDSFPGFVVHLFELYAAKRLGRPVVLVSQSIGPFRRRWSRVLARAVLERCEVILPREKFSERYLAEELCISRPKVSLIPDLAFAPSDRGAEGEEGPEGQLRRRIGDGGVIGVTVRYWNFPDEAGRAEELNSDFQRRLADLLDSLVDDSDMEVVFFPQALTPDFRPSDDRSVSRKVAAMMRHSSRVTLIEDDLPVPQLRAMIGDCRLFVGTRMHSNIFALTAGVPTLGIAYLPKTQGIMELVGLGELVVEMDGSPEEFRCAARRLVDEQDTIRRRLQERIPELQAWIRSTLDSVLSDALRQQGVSAEDGHR